MYTDFCRRFFISNSRQFRRLRKLSSIQCRSSLVVKNGLGGSGTHDLNSSGAFLGCCLPSILYYLSKGERAREREPYNQIPLGPFFTSLVNYCSKMSTFSSGFRTKLSRNAWGKFDIKKFYLMRGYLTSRDIMRRLALIVPSLSGSDQYYNTTYIYSALLFRTTE